MIGLVGVRHTVPAQSQIQSEPVGGAPVVLHIRGIGNVVPLTSNLDGVFIVPLAKTEKVIGEVVAGERAIELELAFGIAAFAACGPDPGTGFDVGLARSGG